VEVARRRMGWTLANFFLPLSLFLNIFINPR
jgi:hypothetical protein